MEEFEFPKHIGVYFAWQGMDMALTHDNCHNAAKITLLEEQIVPGDMVFMENTNSTLTAQQLTVVKVLNIAEHLQNPEVDNAVKVDWANRLADNWIFGQWRSTDCEDGGYGWFSRRMAIPVATEVGLKYWELIPSMDEEFDFDHAEDLEEAFRRNSVLRDMSHTDWDPMVCPECISGNVVVKAYRTEKHNFNVMRMKNDRDKIVIYSCGGHDFTYEGTLTCLDCGWSEPVTEENLLDIRGDRH